MVRVGDFEFSVKELSGAMGDWGTLLPICIGFMAVNGMHPAQFMLVFGLTNIATGLVYRAPMPLQPMKAIAAVAIAGSWSPDLITATGLSMGVFWLLMSASGRIETFLRNTPAPVVRGIQLALGISLGWTGITMMADETWWLGIVALLLIAFMNRGERRGPSALLVVLLGLGVMVYQGTLEWHIPGLSLPTLSLPDPALAWKGFLLGGIGQIPLTLTNAVIACAALMREYFPQREVAERRLMFNMGIMNIGSSLLGGFPMCHGAGGLASQYYFGARTGGANILEGLLEVALGLFFGTALLNLFTAFPAPLIGAMMVMVGIELGKFSQGLHRSSWPTAAVTVSLGVIVNLGAGFVGGLATELIVNHFRHRRDQATDRRQN